jgi:hypothetical protein
MSEADLARKMSQSAPYPGTLDALVKRLEYRPGWTFDHRRHRRGSGTQMSHHRIALYVIAAALILTIADGLAFAAAEHIPAWHGIYCIWMTEVTVGGDVQPASWGYACLAFAPFPLLAAAFSLFTSALAAVHVHAAKREILKGIKP